MFNTIIFKMQRALSFSKQKVSLPEPITSHNILENLKKISKYDTVHIEYCLNNNNESYYPILSRTPSSYGHITFDIADGDFIVHSTEWSSDFLPSDMNCIELRPVISDNNSWVVYKDGSVFSKDGIDFEKKIKNIDLYGNDNQDYKEGTEKGEGEEQNSEDNKKSEVSHLFELPVGACCKISWDYNDDIAFGNIEKWRKGPSNTYYQIVESHSDKIVISILYVTTWIITSDGYCRDSERLDIKGYVKNITVI